MNEIEQGVKMIKALADFANGVDHREFARAMHQRVPDAYTREKFQLMQASLPAYIGVLDSANLRWFVAAALERFDRHS